SNDTSGKGYDVVMLGTTDDRRIDVDAMQRRLDQPEYARVRASLQEVALGSAVDLLARYGGRASDLAPWLAGAQINRDRDLRLQYLAGLAVNDSMSEQIFDEMLRYRRYPDDLF